MRVRVIYDWMGALGSGYAARVAPLSSMPAAKSLFQPPRLDSPFGWLSRDHRKMVAVDGEVGYRHGPVRQPQVGRRCRAGQGAVARYRHRMRGPAVADIERAFAETWAATGTPIPEEELTRPDAIPAAGTVMLRVLATQPSIAGLYRLDQ